MKKFTKLLVVSLVVLLMGVSRVNAATSTEKLNELFGIIRENINNIAIKILDPKLVGSTDILAQTVEAAISNLSAVNNYISTNLKEKFDIEVTCENVTSCVVNVGENSYPVNPSTLLETAEKISSKVQEIIAGQFTQNEDGSITANYNLFDMDFINFMYNNIQNGMEGIMNIELNTIYNYFPELQSINEALENKYNAWFEGGTDNATIGEVVTSITSPFIAYYNEIMSNYGEGKFNFAPIILVGKGTTENEYVQAALARINEYIGKTNIPVKLEKTGEEVTDEQKIEISKFLKNAGDITINYTSYKAKLTIGTKSFDVYIVKVDEKEALLSTYNAISTSTMYGELTAMLTTKGLDVPADVQLFIKDVTDKFKDSSLVDWVPDWVLDINLYSESAGKYITQTDNGFEIKIPVKSDFTKEGHSIWYVIGEVLKEPVPYKVIEEEGQKYVVFTVSHLSEYAMVNDEANVENEDDKPLEDNPKTGYVAAITLCSVLGIGCAGAMIYMKKKNLIKNI